MKAPFPRFPPAPPTCVPSPPPLSLNYKKCSEKLSLNNKLHLHINAQYTKKPAKNIEKSPPISPIPSTPQSPPPSPQPSPAPPAKTPLFPHKPIKNTENLPPTPPVTPTKSLPSLPTSPAPPTYAEVALREIPPATPAKCTKPHEISQLNPRAPIYLPPQKRNTVMTIAQLFTKFRRTWSCPVSFRRIEFKCSNGSIPAGLNVKLIGQSGARNSTNFAASSANSACAKPTFFKAFSTPSLTPQYQSPSGLRQHKAKPSYWLNSPQQAFWLSSSPPWPLRKSLETGQGIATLLQGLSQLLKEIGHGICGKCVI